MTDSREIRCEGTLYGRLTDERWFEVKCKRRRCGYAKGIIILHTIDITTGEVVSTKKFAEPKPGKEGRHASHNARAAVRSA